MLCYKLCFAEKKMVALVLGYKFLAGILYLVTCTTNPLCKLILHQVSSIFCFCRVGSVQIRNLLKQSELQKKMKENCMFLI